MLRAKSVTLPFENDVVVISATEYFGNDAVYYFLFLMRLMKIESKPLLITSERIRYEKYKMCLES